MTNAVLTTNYAYVRSFNASEAWLWWRSTDSQRSVEGGQRNVHAPLSR
ncbi:MAG: hypothetical protein H7A35_08600 [Planctomycetales bacterium]|nr:hypothetical protein [bacterium]UNM06942.1 MAG: hypothetical protein H7A35_08600 [Planctomycetales bacterium]